MSAVKNKFSNFHASMRTRILVPVAIAWSLLGNLSFVKDLSPSALRVLSLVGLLLGLAGIASLVIDFVRSSPDPRSASGK